MHPSTIYPGGVGTVATPHAVHRLPRRGCCAASTSSRRPSPMNDDVFDFFYEALPGYEEVGRRRILLGCWGAFKNPDVRRLRLPATWTTGATRCSSPRASSSTASSSPPNLVDINLGIRILLGSSYYDDWAERGDVRRARTRSATRSTSATRGTRRRSRKPQKRDLDGGNYSWVMSPRWYDKRTGDHLALDTGGGALARLWATALANKVDTPYVNATGNERADHAAEDARHARDGARVEDPAVVQRDRARPRADLLRRLRGGDGAALPRQGARARSAPGDTKVFEDFEVPDEAIGCGFHEAVRGVLSHHLVIRDGKIANYHPYPPTPWNGSPRDSYGTPGPVRGRGAGPADLRGERPGRLPGHRHHAHGAQLRPVPAVRRAHVPRPRSWSGRSRSGPTRSSATARGYYFVAYAAGMALHFLDRAFEDVRAGRTKVFDSLKHRDNR